MSPGRCELCDLPVRECVHGMRNRKGTQNRAAKNTSKRSAKTSRKKPQREGRWCSDCGKKAAYRRYSVCLSCGKAKGFVLCTRCGQYFRPDAGTTTKRTCRTCRRPPRASSAWVIAQAGSPGLGKRR